MLSDAALCYPDGQKIATRNERKSGLGVQQMPRAKLIGGFTAHSSPSAMAKTVVVAVADEQKPLSCSQISLRYDAFGINRYAASSFALVSPNLKFPVACRHFVVITHSQRLMTSCGGGARESRVIALTYAIFSAASLA